MGRATVFAAVVLAVLAVAGAMLVWTPESAPDGLPSGEAAQQAEAGSGLEGEVTPTKPRVEAAPPDGKASGAEPQRERGRSTGSPMRGSTGDAAAGAEEDPPSRIAVEGSLVWHESVDREAFDVTYRRSGEELERPIYLATEGIFRLFRSQPGEIDVLVRLKGDPIPLATIASVVVPEAGVQRDPRLQGIDVREVREIVLTLVDPADVPIRGVRHALLLRPDLERGRHVSAPRPSGSSRSRGHVRLPEGELPFLTRLGDQPLIVWARGYVPRRLRVAGDTRLTLVTAVRVRVDLKLETSYPAGMAQPRLQPEGAKGTSSEFAFRQQGAALPEEMGVADVPVVTVIKHDYVGKERRTWVFAVSKPGRYRAEWAWVTAGEERGKLREYVGGATIVEVAGGSGEAVSIELTLTDADLDAAKQAAAGKGPGKDAAESQAKKPAKKAGKSGGNGQRDG